MNSKKKTVLVVDDSSLVRRQVRATLASAGYETIEANSGASALVLLRSREVALVITDVTMPEMSGLELIQELRADLTLEAVSVIILSTLGTATLVQQGLRLGVSAWLKKPFKPDLLTNAVDSLLSATGKGGEACAS